MAMTKQARDNAMKKIAEAESRDIRNAFDVGFAKLGHDIGLTEEEFEQFYAAGVARYEQLEAERNAKK